MKRRDDPEIVAWFAKVADDLRIARLALDDVPPVIDPACFHAQQAAEKALKALMAAIGLEVPRTHDVVALVKVLSGELPDIVALREAVASVSPFAVSTRYPFLAVNASADEAREALRHAYTVVAWIEARLASPSEE